MLSLNDIKRIISLNRTELFSKYNLRELAIFGSFSRGEANESSDIDILVDFSRSVGIELIDLADELEILLNKKVDLVSKNAIKPRYYKYIENELVYV